MEDEQGPGHLPGGLALEGRLVAQEAEVQRVHLLLEAHGGDDVALLVGGCDVGVEGSDIVEGDGGGGGVGGRRQGGGGDGGGRSQECCGAVRRFKNQSMERIFSFAQQKL